MSSNAPYETNAFAPSSPSPVVDSTQTPSRHHMVTCSRVGIHKPNPKYANLHALVDLPQEPKTILSDLNHRGWNKAMQDETQALHDNHTWTLMPRTPSMDVIGCKWVFQTKINADGSLDRLKARLVAKGFHQMDEVNYIETFSPIIKPGTIRIVLTLALFHRWDIR
ncbi:uncharacterized mitochondrial protein AtMg00820-like [Juglans microcarpa x Juglans regia]|uniref:uncharacterized mitochondrial protein AtMg00820-like n=1 Tax=Juglans microcarpa x Juglans regia TaxID=2249226 RepID=UPI001B7E38E5|nr:uncharacterized mitochondrial protein AtMg00820-like [Juglans microcarpa x Juglans regia]